MGDIYVRTYDFNKAIECFSKILEIQKQRFGEEHQDTASTYFILGMTWAQLQEFDVALEHLRKSRDIYERLYGADNQQTQRIGGIINSVESMMSTEASSD